MTTPLTSRRALLAFAFASSLAGLVACKSNRASGEARCAHCGMKVDKDSAWRVELVTKDGKSTFYDTPRCAFAARTGGTASLNSVLKVRDYYDRSEHLADDMRFVVGTDVVGPMGKDLVPVTPAHVEELLKGHGHGTAKALTMVEVTKAVVDGLE